MRPEAKIVAWAVLAVVLAGERWNREETLERANRLAVATAVVQEQKKSWELMEKMAPKQQVEDAIRHQREKASHAQEAIVSEYLNVYCIDHTQENDAQKQMTMYGASLLSRLSIGAGVDMLALAEYAKCKKH